MDKLIEARLAVRLKEAPIYVGDERVIMERRSMVLCATHSYQKAVTVLRNKVVRRACPICIINNCDATESQSIEERSVVL